MLLSVLDYLRVSSDIIEPRNHEPIPTTLPSHLKTRQDYCTGRNRCGKCQSQITVSAFSVAGQSTQQQRAVPRGPHQLIGELPGGRE